MSLKDTVRKLTPTFLLEWNRSRKKASRNKTLENQKASGQALNKETLINQIKGLGILAGDTILVHSSLSKIGYIENGPQTLIEAFIEVIGEQGNLLMPTSPNGEYQFDFIQKKPVFDVRNTPSKTGAITETFRKMEGVVRSIHPTEPVAAYGPQAKWLTEGHFNELTPYTDKSPFYRVSELGGKLVYIGVTLDNAGTNLHTLEDAVDFKYPIYSDEIFNVEVIDYEGKKHTVKTKVHNPEFSKKRQCDKLIPGFEKAGILSKGKVGEAAVLVFDAKGFLETMLVNYTEKGITMYTPFGNQD